MTEETTIRVLLVDDHTVVRKGLNALLSTPRFQIEVVGEAADGLEAVEQVRELQPDVTLMDLEMPRMNGIEAIAAIKQEHPQARILVLTSFNELDRAKDAIQAGATGFLLKDSSPDDLVHAIRSIHRGQLLIPGDVADYLLAGSRDKPAEKSDADALTKRERAILDGLVQGLSNKEIGALLHISGNTVRSHVANILSKLGVTNRTQAAMYAVEHDLLIDR